MTDDLLDHCENIDAAIFSGDALWSRFDELKDYVGRWSRAIAEHEEFLKQEPARLCVNCKWHTKFGIVNWDGCNHKKIMSLVDGMPTLCSTARMNGMACGVDGVLFEPKD